MNILSLSHLASAIKHWFFGNSWGGSKPRSLDELLDANLAAGRLVWTWERE